MTFTVFNTGILADPSHADYKLHYLKSLFNDKTAGEGPYPDGGNFADEELQNFLYVASGDVNAAFIQGCQTLASAWSSFAISERSKVGGFDAKDVAEQWEKRAEKARQNPVTEVDPGVVKIKRVNPYVSLT